MASLRGEVSGLMAGESRKFTRRPFERMYRIRRAIASGQMPTCTRLAEELEVTPKTVQRDIDFMRDAIGMPLVYDEQSHGWRFDGAVEDFPDFEVGAEELAALFLARAATDSLGGTVLADKLRQVFAKLTRSINDRVQLNWADLDEAFSRKAPELKGRDVMLFGKLAEAVVNRTEVEFHYLKLAAEKAEPRRVRPLHLGEVDGAWYLIGHDVERGALRTFALPRLTRLKVKAKTFERPRDFDGRDYLRRSFGVWTVSGDDSLRLVRVRLKDYAARLAQERRWHPTQEIKRLNAAGTCVEVCFEAGALEEVVRWVLSFGSKAKVIGPPELKELVRDEVRLMGG